ncbi:MAG: cobalt ECF transporter T component CbiQ [Cyanobacteriota bacterium]|nr:cobalt ECF transporter T component CbiQ [Cyanobacteriota bacterium]
MTHDQYTYLNSPIHRWETKPKLVSLVLLIFAFAFVRDWVLLPAMLGVTAVLYAVSKLPLSFLFEQLRYPSFFLLGIVALLPFFSGETVLWQWGAIALHREGLQATLLIAGRFLSIVTLGLILLKTTPVLKLIEAMRSLGLPSILTDMTLLTYRYLFEIADSLAAMQRAMRLRGFRSQVKPRKILQPDRQEIQGIALLAGTLLVRSYEQSERVYKAMRLRGYGLPSTPSSKGLWREGWGGKSSKIAAIAVVLIALGFIIHV